MTLRPLASIRDIVVREYALHPGEICSPSRDRRVARPRQVGMYLCYRLTDASNSMIGIAFGNRDHSTVIHARKVIPMLMAENPAFAAEVLRLERLIMKASELPRAFPPLTPD